MRELYLPDSMVKVAEMFNILHEQTLTGDQVWHLVTLIDLVAGRELCREVAAGKVDLATGIPPLVGNSVEIATPAHERIPTEAATDDAAETPESVVDIPEEAWDDPARYPQSGTRVADIPEEAWCSPGTESSGDDDIYESSEKWWTPTHLWKIHVEPYSRDDPDALRYYVHCRHKPTQELFNQHYQMVHNGTHRVYVLQSNGATSVDITREFLFSGKPVSAETATVKTQDWEEPDANVRIRFWDTRVGGLNYVYFRNRPSGIVLAKYHSAKQYAVVEPRPEC